MQPSSTNQRQLVSEFVACSDTIGHAADGFLKRNFNTPDAYVELIKAHQQRETLLMEVLAMFREVVGETFRQTTYAQANLILSNILQRTQGKKVDRFAQTFEALATIAVISFDPKVDKLDTPLAMWIDGPRGAEFHLFHGDLQQLIPYGIGFIPDVLKHWLEVRPDILAKSEALRILGPNLINVIMNCNTLCHELDDNIEDDEGVVQDRVCQIMSLDPPKFNLWDLVAMRDVFWVWEDNQFKKIHVWKFYNDYNKRVDNNLYYWEDGEFLKVSAEFELVTSLVEIETPSKFAVNKTPVSIPERVEYLYAVTHATREKTRVSWI